MKIRFTIHELFLFAFVLAIAALMWVVHRHELELQRNDLVRDVALAEKFINDRLEGDQAFIEQLAREKSDGTLTREQFETRVSQRALENLHWVAVVWTEPTLNIMWTAPSNRIIDDILRVRPSFAEQARLSRLTAVTNRATYSMPYQAERAYYIEYTAPLISGAVSLGNISALMNVTAFPKAFLPEWFLSKYDISITDENGTVMSFTGSGITRSVGYLAESQKLSLPWRGFQIEAKAQQRGSTLTGITVTTTIMFLAGLIAWSLNSLRLEGLRRAKSEQRTKAVNDRFETVLDSLNASVYVSDALTDELLYANGHFRDTFPEYNPYNLRPFEATFAPNIESLLNSDALDFDSVSRHECQHIPTGRWFITRVRRVRWADGRVACLHTLGDVTDRVEAEQMSRQQQERLMLTSRLMTAGEMASTLAHEINQPLAAITNYLNGCMQRLRNGASTVAEITPAIEKATTQAERAGKIINRVREFVRTRDPQREELDMRVVLDDVRRFAEPDPTKPTVLFTNEIGASLPHVFADRIMIEQVLLNLIRNAREAMSGMPLEQREVVLRAVQNHAEYVTVSVSDRGPGLAKEVAENLFSPFMTTKSEGMGMGLSICRSIIEYHEGQMRHIPNSPHGAIFEFTLPIAQDE